MICGGELRVAVGSGRAVEADVDGEGFFGGFGVKFGMDDGDSAEKKIGDVGEDGSSPGGDEVSGEKFIELGKGIVDAHSGGEVVAIGSEDSGDMGGIRCLFVFEGVTEAKQGARFGDGKSAEPAGGSAEGTVRSRVTSCSLHGIAFLDVELFPNWELFRGTRVISVRVANKGVSCAIGGKREINCLWNGRRCSADFTRHDSTK